MQIEGKWGLRDDISIEGVLNIEKNRSYLDLKGIIGNVIDTNMDDPVGTRFDDRLQLVSFIKQNS